MSKAKVVTDQEDTSLVNARFKGGTDQTTSLKNATESGDHNVSANGTAQELALGQPTAAMQNTYEN